MKRLIYILAFLPLIATSQYNDVRVTNQFVVVTHADSTLFSGYYESVRVESASPVTAHDDLSTVDASYFPDLPETGQPVEGGKIYNYNGSAVMAVQSHIRTEHAPETVPALFATYRVDNGDLDWIVNENVVVGSIRTYQSEKYEAIQKHMTLEAWIPPATLGVLWKYYEEPTSGCDGVKTWNAADHWTTYSLGDKRIDAGQLWEVKNVGYTYYQPSGPYGHFGWTKLQDCP